MALDSNIPVAYLRECLAYDPGTGALTWRARPRGHFRNGAVWRNWNAKHAGKLAGTDDHGYRIIRLRCDGCGFKLYAHRIGFALANGRWPADQIDHRNRRGEHNQLINLREASHGLNEQNKGLRSDNTSGVKGVWWYDRVGKWMAAIGVGGRARHLGYFITLEEAAKARRDAEIDLHPFRPVA